MRHFWQQCLAIDVVNLLSGRPSCRAMLCSRGGDKSATCEELLITVCRLEASWAPFFNLCSCSARGLGAYYYLLCPNAVRVTGIFAVSAWALISVFCFFIITNEFSWKSRIGIYLFCFKQQRYVLTAMQA